MKVVSCNIGRRQTIVFRGKDVDTGIYKTAVSTPIQLMRGGVEGDNVIDRRYHGGEDQAVYLYSSGHYSYWKTLYPDLAWEWGMFGENLTIKGLDEHQVYPGDRFKVGEHVILELTKAREPCYKLGHKFGSSKIIRQFMDLPYPGVYARVIQEGIVRAGDAITHIRSGTSEHSIAAIYLSKMKLKSQTP